MCLRSSLRVHVRGKAKCATTIRIAASSARVQPGRSPNTRLSSKASFLFFSVLRLTAFARSFATLLFGATSSRRFSLFFVSGFLIFDVQMGKFYSVVISDGEIVFGKNDVANFWLMGISLVTMFRLQSVTLLGKSVTKFRQNLNASHNTFI